MAKNKSLKTHSTLVRTHPSTPHCGQHPPLPLAVTQGKGERGRGRIEGGG